MIVTSQRHVHMLDGRLATVGIDVPAVLEVLGHRLELEDMLFACLDAARSTGEGRSVDDLRSELSSILGEVRAALVPLEDGDKADGLLHAGLALRKALDILDAPLERRQADDTERWLDFVKKIRYD